MMRISAPVAWVAKSSSNFQCCLRPWDRQGRVPWVARTRRHHCSAAGTERTFSGIQPTGAVHLGNYLGAVKLWADTLPAGRRDSNLFCLVDLHAITLPQEPGNLKLRTVEMAACLVACGLDPARCILFQQSTVSQHCQLCWFLTTLTTVPALSRLSQYKDKSSGLREVPLGLFMYPVLQAADILLYKASKVPVGEDNLQNVEMARRLARLFNNRFGVEVFPEPEPVLAGSGARIRSLRNPAKKMSKSDEDKRSCIFVTDDPDSIRDKVKKAVTDNVGRVTYDPQERPGVSNLLTIHSAVAGKSVEEVCAEAGDANTAAYKDLVAEALIEHLRPIREQTRHLLDNKDYLQKILEEGSAAAQALAEATMAEVKGAVGMSLF